MDVAIIFHNIGGYHAARLRAAAEACRQAGLTMMAVQVANGTHEHPWGDLQKEITFSTKTLLSATQAGSSVSAAALLTDYLNEVKPRVVVIPGWGFPESRAALSWCRHNSALSVLMSESKWDDEKRQWWKEQIKSRLYVRRFDAALVGGDLHRRYLLKLGFPSERIALGYDVVDNDYFAARAEAARRNREAARQRQPNIPPRPFFLAATRLIPRKNVSRLIDAYAEYRQSIGQAAAWDLVICGSGVEESLLRQRISEKQLGECVHLPGFVSYQEIGDWYGLADAFIHPAWQEQWGLVINEACAAGLPILSSRTVGAAHEIVLEKENGILFDPFRTNEIARSLIALHRMSQTHREAMGRASREIIAHFRPEKFADGLMKCIRVASEGKPHRSALHLARS